MVRSTKKPPPKNTEQLARLQRIARESKTPNSAKPPTEGITSSAERLAQQLNELHAWILNLASEHHVTATNILDDMERRL